MPFRGPPRRAAGTVVLQLVARLDGDEAGDATLDVARALHASGWRALVASGGGARERELRQSRAELIRLPLETGGPLRQWQTARSLLRLCRQEQVGLIHARSPETAVLAAELSRRADVPYVVTAHQLPDANGRRDAAYRAALGTAARIIAVSEYAAEQLVTGASLGPERVVVIPRWIDLADFDPDRVRGHRVAAAAERCGLHVGPKIVGVPAEIAVTDGRELLLAAVSRLTHQNFMLLFLGHLPEARDGVARLTAALQTAGLDERARFGTGIEDLPGALAAIDVLLVPATQPRMVASLAVAAQAMGKPVIVTAVGGLAEAVMPAVTGWLLPPEDPGEIAWALDLALRMDEDVRDRVARRAREFAAATFGAPAALGRQLEVYAEVLQEAGSLTREHAAE